MHLRFTLTSALLSLTMLFWTTTLVEGAPDRPNIIFIMVDDLGPEWISCYGADDVETPVVDRLAAGGMRFTVAYSMPKCTPTRATLLTGQYPFRHGWVNHWDVPRWGAGCHFDPDHNVTFPALLRKSGYATAIAGKWQINDFRIQPDVLEELGFDDWCMWTGFETGNKPSAERYWDPYVHTREGSKTYAGRFGADVFADFIISFLKKNREKPMMVYFPMALTHGPLVTTPREPKAEGKLPRHKAMVRYVDHTVGRIVNALDELEIRKRTIVVFTTDNGTSKGITGHIAGRAVRGGKGSLSETGCWAPFIVNCPGRVPSGVVTDCLTDFTDLLPTFCELGGADVPEDLALDGQSFAEVILGKQEDGPREWILAMGGGVARLTTKGRVVPDKDYAPRAIRDKRYKLIVNVRGETESVFDLEEDPGEKTNLIDSRDESVVVARKRLESAVRTFPARDAAPRYDPTPPQPWDRPGPEAMQRVGQWNRFEAVVENMEHYGDPCRDVTLDVTFTRPDGTEVRFWGFHDGGSTWRLRTMPDRLGTWRYQARFSDGAPGISGSFACVPSDIPGILATDEVNPLWFGYRGGRHVLIRSLHVGDRFFAENWPAEKRKAFLDWVELQGYNMLSIASHYLNRDSEGRGRGWETPDLWPLDAAEFRKLESLLDDLARRRILAYPFAGFFSKGSDFPKDPVDQTLYIRYVLARLGPYWNILFNVAGPEPNLKKQAYLDSPDVIRLGEEIGRLDIYRHMISVHNRTGDDPYRDSTWNTHLTLQGPKTADLHKLSEGLLRNHHPQKPLFAQETLWPGNKYHKALRTDDDVRKNAYVILMSGAAINYGDMEGNSSSGFSGTLDLERRVQSRHDLIHRVWDVLESVPWYRLRPHQDLVNQGFCLAEPGRHYLVYLDDGGGVDVSVEGGPYVVQWINARDPIDRRTGGLTRDGHGLVAPSEGEDWLLRLRRPTGVFTVRADNTGTELDGRPFLAVGLRISNALLSDATTRDLLDHLDELASFGVNTLSVFFQGSRFGDIRGYRADGSLEPAHAVRMGRIIEAADERGMVVLVGCLYHGNSRGRWESWKQEDADRAVANTVHWLRENGYRNVVVDVNNEHMAKFDDARLISAGGLMDASYVIGTSGKETPANAGLSLHHGSPDIPGKYYIQSEGTMQGGYWGSYSKREGYYNYVRIGVYPDDMKRKMLDYTDRYLDRGQGFLFASTWLQCVPPHGPNHRPGGHGTPDDPGIRWWLEHLRERVGPHLGSRQQDAH